MKHIIACSALTLLLATMVSTPVASARYQLQDLGAVKGSNFSYPFGINDKGQVVGISQINYKIGGDFYATLWDKGTATNLGLGLGISINDNGQVVGWAPRGKDLAPCATLWQDGKAIDISGGSPTQAFAINNLGQIVGCQGYGYDGATLWQDGVMKVFAGGNAFDINNRGQICGWPRGPYPGAVIWENGEENHLGMFCDHGAFASCINDVGEAAGYGWLPDDGMHAFVWMDGEMRDIGVLPGTNKSWALSINDLGQVVGLSHSDVQGDKACLWEDGSLYDPNDLIPTDSGWYLWEATGINNRGQIAAKGGRNGITHAVLLTPEILSIRIDVDPKDDSDPVEVGRKKTLQIAVLSSADFNAGLVIPSSAAVLGARPDRWKLKDVNSDGYKDLLLRFAIRDMFFEPGSVNVQLRGRTVDSRIIEGSDRANLSRSAK
jgi:probable HAF family extracellular repeat protein